MVSAKNHAPLGFIDLSLDDADCRYVFMTLIDFMRVAQEPRKLPIIGTKLPRHIPRMYDLFVVLPVAYDHCRDRGVLIANDVELIGPPNS